MDVRAQLKAHRVDFKARTVPGLRLRQIFLKDPTGVAIELNFPAAEAA
jgi:hypothetical protein